MEPLRKALRLPRVNLFIADDTGLGKTIEAGLIARELLLRKKAKTIVVVAPPSVLEQWKAELEERFGLVFFDTLRAPRKQNEKVANWRREAPIRPVVFEDTGVLTEDTVHLHLEQRVAQRLLARFRSQGFIHHDLSRACLAQVADSIPRVVLLSRLSLYGQGAERLHEELVPLAARWIEPSQRKGPLTPYAREAEAKTLDLLEHSLGSNGRRPPDEAIQRKPLTATPRDIEELLPQLEPRAEELALLAIDKLRKRGEREEKDLRETLERQRQWVREELAKNERDFTQLTFDFGDEEKRQLESDMRSWRGRLDQFERDLQREPHRVREFYEVRAKRIEPVGLVYLWPESN